MSKRDLSEADICAKFIMPNVEKAGWDDATEIRGEVHFTKGQIHVRGKMVTRGKSKFADYVLYYKPNIPIAIIEAKENNRAISDGMQQALDGARLAAVRRPTLETVAINSKPCRAGSRVRVRFDD
jgi:type I restriction enzyme, R subunit